jgi:hypothetical protein
MFACSPTCAFNRERGRGGYRNGENEPFFAEPDFGRYEELFDGSATLDFFCCGLSNGAREWGPYCCALTKKNERDVEKLRLTQAAEPLTPAEHATTPKIS